MNYCMLQKVCRKLQCCTVIMLYSRSALNCFTDKLKSSFLWEVVEAYFGIVFNYPILLRKLNNHPLAIDAPLITMAKSLWTNPVS